SKKFGELVVLISHIYVLQQRSKSGITLSLKDILHNTKGAFRSSRGIGCFGLAVRIRGAVPQHRLLKRGCRRIRRNREISVA
ncbi:hypothetical protein, partial [Pseudophaeobacter profundi]|uniref:hypothetical protein n=1 Tax=Pseudophaeobacter profundi TaxID=3034152 RepID=UPI00242E13B7